MLEASGSHIVRAVSILIAACLVVFPAQAKYSGGTGEPNDPYQIATAADLIALGETPGDYDKHFLLTADIDLDPNLPGRKVFGKAVIAPDTEDAEWWFQGTAFTGVFDGDGHRISHLTIMGENWLGLFGQLAGWPVRGQLRNLSVIDVSITGSGNHVGGLVGSNEGSMTDCHSAGTVMGGGGSYDVGGLVGGNRGGLIRCDSTCVVSGGSGVGGLVGGTCGDVNDCSSAGQVNGDRSVGGLAGGNGCLLGSCGKGLVRCRSTATVSGEECVGGLVGYNGGQISQCFSSGAVNGRSEVGGLVGGNGENYDGQQSESSSGGPIVDSYSTGSVSGQDQVGGLLGANTDGRLTRCYSSGGVAGSGRVGGLVGCNYDDENGWVNGSFWDIQTAGLKTSSGGIGKTTAEMQTATTFLKAGWDFAGEEENDTNDVWWIDEGSDYPRLICELPEGASPRPLSAVFPPYPRNGTTNLITSVVLSWHGSDEATGYDVYLGIGRSAVMDATPESLGIYCGRQSADSNTYDPGALEAAQTYYWRIDEVNEADPSSPWRGAVWSFTTAEYITLSVMDDFEGYNDEEDRIYDTWIDGVSYGDTNNPAGDANHPPYYAGNGTGSLVGNWLPPFAEQQIVHGGCQSMPMDYNNLSEPWYSEAERTWEPAQDWTVDGVDALTLYFRGNPVRYAESDGVITMTGSGRGLNYFWSSYEDDVRFAYRLLDGDGSIVAKVAFIGEVSSWAAQAGVMIRENLDPHSKCAYIVCSPTPRISFGSRPDPVFGPDVIVGTQAPQWVKLTREGDVFTAQCSIDGETWTDFKDPRGPANSTKIAMPGSVYIGLCVASGGWELTDLITTAVFSDITTTGDVTGEWQVASIGDDAQAGNTPEDLYVRIEDSNGAHATVVHPDAEAVLATEWQKWHIALADVRAAGVDVATVQKMVIGVGDRENPQPGGTGRIYIDDIRLTKRMP